MYSDLYCTKCDNFRPKCKNIDGGRAFAAEALPLIDPVGGAYKTAPPDPLAFIG